MTFDSSLEDVGKDGQISGREGFAHNAGWVTAPQPHAVRSSSRT